MRTQTLVVTAWTVALLGCTDQPGDVDLEQAFLVWDPGSALMTEHRNWHSAAFPGCGNPGQRKCGNSGEDFLVFHRNFLDRLRDAFEAQPLSADITPWYTIPPELKTAAVGWTTALANAENAIKTMIDPVTGQRFSSLNAYGTYVETRLHNFLHGLAARAYGEAAVGGAAMSPSSTYFFKIHGWVEYHFQRFQRGDFNKDGYSDFFWRNTSNGGNQIQMMAGTAPLGAPVPVTHMPVDSCQYYVGATVDMDFDGNVDLVWHGPGCTQALVWLMSGASMVSSVPLAAPEADSQLIGADDFDRDMRPDLVWRLTVNDNVRIWKMNGTTRVSTHWIDIISPYTPLAVADANGNGMADIILGQLASGFRYYRYANMTGSFFQGFTTLLGQGLKLDPAYVLAGTGRFQNIGSPVDLVFNNFAGATPAFSFGLQSGPQYVLNNGGTLLPNVVNQGPR